jgi:hypothetical protein
MSPGNGNIGNYDTWIYRGFLTFISIAVSIICYLVWIPYNNITNTITKICNDQRQDHDDIKIIKERQDMVRENNKDRDKLISEHTKTINEHEGRLNRIEDIVPIRKGRAGGS